MATFSLLSSLVICSVVNGGPAPSAEPAGESVRLHLVGGRPVVDGVYLGSEGPFRFLVDTGAESNQLDSGIARRLGLRPTFRVEVVSANGVSLVPGGRLPGVTLGSATASDQEFLFGDLEGIRRLSAGIEGVIGQEFLSRFDYLLDYAGRQLVFGARPRDGGSRLELARIHGVPAIATSAGHLILDSGTDTLVLFRRPAPEAQVGGGVELSTHSGASWAWGLPQVRLRIAGKEYRATPAAIAPQPSRDEAGLLPASLFRQVYVCNSENYVVLNPRPSSGPARRQ